MTDEKVKIKEIYVCVEHILPPTDNPSLPLYDTPIA